MLSEEKIRKMIRLSDYEKGQGGIDLRRTRFMKMDYVRLQILKTIVSVFLAAILAAVLFAMYHMEYILAHALEIPYLSYFLWFGGILFVVLVVSIVATCHVAAKQYRESLVRVGEYRATLQELVVLYESEEQEDTVS